MSSGNRGASPSTDGPKAAPRVGAPTLMAVQAGPSGVRSIVIAVAVIGLAIAGAFFVSDKVAAASTREVIRPIEQLAAELNRDQLKTALATQAFPDRAGKAFMTKVAHFPKDHNALLGRLADAAKAGADRNGLVQTLDSWADDFAYAHYRAISNTGSTGFDRSMQLANAQLDARSKKGVCSVFTVRRIVEGPFEAVPLADYGTAGYTMLVQSKQTLVDLAITGQKMPLIESGLRVSDGKAVLSAFKTQLKDPAAMSIIQTMVDSVGGDPKARTKKKSRPKKGAASQPMTQLAPDEVDICALGRTITGKMQGLPADTKQRLWATSVSHSTTAYISAHR